MEIKPILIWIFIFVIAGLTVSVISQPSTMSNFISSIKSKTKLSATSSLDFPCIDSLKEYIKIEKIKRSSFDKIEVQEIKLFTNKTNLKDYFIKWGEGGYNLEDSIVDLDKISFPVYVALIRIEKCSVYSCGAWFDWGICKDENKKEFERINTLL